MGQVIWTQEDRYFQGLCGNELYTETPPDNMKGAGCYACIWPFPGTIPENACSEHLLPDPTHTYILKTNAGFSVDFTYPTATMESHIVSKKVRNPSFETLPSFFDGFTGGPSGKAFPGVVNSRQFTTTAGIESYDNLWEPESLWLADLLNSLTLDKVADYIIPTSQYVQRPGGGWNAANPPWFECYWMKEVVTLGQIQSTTLTSELEPLITGWDFYDPPGAGPLYNPPYVHNTRCQFYDQSIGRTILRISAVFPTSYPGGNILVNPVPLWEAGQYSVSVIHFMTHKGWLGPSNFAIPSHSSYSARIWGQPLAGSGNPWSWASEMQMTRGHLYLDFGFPFGVEYMFPKIEIRAMYKYTAPDLATFMSLEDFTCTLQTASQAASSVGNPLPLIGDRRRISDPTGVYHPTQYAVMFGPEYQSGTGNFRFWSSNPGNLTPAKSIWSCDHLLTLPSSVVVSRLDVTPGS